MQVCHAEAHQGLMKSMYMVQVFAVHSLHLQNVQVLPLFADTALQWHLLCVLLW